MSKTTDCIIDTKLYYGDKEFTIGSLGLEPTYAYALYRVVKFKRPDGVLDGITFSEITSIRTIGATKARGIAEALSKLGAEVKNIPEVKANEPAMLTPSKRGTYFCTSCHGEVTDAWSANGYQYNYCPMCGKKLKKGV